VRGRSQTVLDLLRRFESRNITFIDPKGGWPIVWERARGNHVWDAEGNKYLDLTAAFGVAAAGHANPAVVRAGQAQMPKLLHAMGDVHPHALKARLAQELSAMTFERWTRSSPQRLDTAGTRSGSHAKTIFCNSGFEAVEAALKTAKLATGQSGILAFKGGYHGLGYGALNATHRTHFRGPFRTQLASFGHFINYPAEQDELGPLEDSIKRALRKHAVGAVLVEPVQTRGGINIPPPGFLPMLRRVCDEQRLLLILDEVYTGFGRTGKWFACEHWDVVPDVICLGKALTGGFPLSACVGRAELMDSAWPTSGGEAIHTSTFLGHPVGCAMALAQIQQLRKLRLIDRSAQLGSKLLRLLASIPNSPGLALSARGLGLLAGLEILRDNGEPATDVAVGVVQRMLEKGFILLPEGEHSQVISFTPPLTIAPTQLESAVNALRMLLGPSKTRA
jgi:4-aminobutyrate aminotransferase-like enzyme